jgi:glucose-1-phosphate adenylyltransferase
VHVHSYSNVEDSVILPNVKVSRNVTLKRVVVDKGCVIPEGLTAGINREEDARRFFVSDNGITLITPDMLGQEVHRVR